MGSIIYECWRMSTANRSKKVVAMCLGLCIMDPTKKRNLTMYRIEVGKKLIKYFFTYREACSFAKSCGISVKCIKPVH